jgi:hypothetical protein
MNPGKFAAAGVSWIRSQFGAKARLVRRVKAKKRARRSGPIPYYDHPKLSVVALPPFDESEQLIVSTLRSSGAEELILCVDGSAAAKESTWVKQLAGPNEFVIRSSRAHGSAGADVGIRFARGEIVCVLSRAGTLLPNREWFLRATNSFERYPHLAALGTTPDGNSRDVQFVAAGERVPFTISSGVRCGPVFFRQKAFVALGGFRFAASELCEGDPVHSFCLKALKAGWVIGSIGLGPPSRS